MVVIHPVPGAAAFALPLSAWTAALLAVGRELSLPGKRTIGCWDAGADDCNIHHEYININTNGLRMA